MICRIATAIKYRISMNISYCVLQTEFRMTYNPNLEQQRPGAQPLCLQFP